MEEQRRNRRNLVQNIIITLLSILALSLFAQSQLYNLDLAEGYNDNGSSQAVRALPASDHLIAPLRVAVTGDYGRYGNIALTTGDNGFIDPLGRCLLEALGSARDYTSCAAGDFFQALGAPSLYYDFLEPLPLSVLAGLLRGGTDISPREDITARRLLIAAQDSGTVLYLWDGSKTCLRAATAVSADSLLDVISRYELGGAVFALDGAADSPERNLDICSLLPGEPPELSSFTLGSPLASTDWLLSALNFNPRSRTRHTESNGTELIMDEDRTLRIRPDHTVYYQAGQGTSLRIEAVEELPTLREAALGAGTLLDGLLSPVCGEARPYLQSLYRNGNTSVIRFGYQINGVPIYFQDGGYAAEVTLTGSAVTALTLRFRQYQPSETLSLLLPLPQALAVAAAAPGKELSIGYVEQGGECRACWLSN